MTPLKSAALEAPPPVTDQAALDDKSPLGLVVHHAGNLPSL